MTRPTAPPTPDGPDGPDTPAPPEPPPFPPEVIPPDPNIVVGEWQLRTLGDVSGPGRDAILHKSCIGRNFNPYGKWGSYTFTYEAATKTTKHYINGDYVSTKSHLYAPDNNFKGSELALFTLDPNNLKYTSAFQQWFRTFRMYNRVLTDQEIRDTYVLDQDFTVPYKPSGVEGKIVELDARVSRRHIDTGWYHCYIENLVNGSMDEFWWTDGEKGNFQSGRTNPNTYLEFDDVYGIYKVNEGRNGTNGAWMSSRFHPDIDVDWTFQYTMNPLSIGLDGKYTFLMAVAMINWTNIELSIDANSCSNAVYPPP